MDARPLFLPILLPTLAAAALMLRHLKSRTGFCAFVGGAVLLNSALLLYLAARPPVGTLTLLRLPRDLSLALRMDGAGAVFAALLACLWPFVALYGLDYMGRTPHRAKPFFACFVLAYGAAAGVALAANLLTLCLFCQLLPLSVLPIMRREGQSIAEAARALPLAWGAFCTLLSLAFVTAFIGNADFAPGGCLPSDALRKPDLLYLIYLLGFLGFGLESALLPLRGWPLASAEASAPASAILNAVAVANAGVFAIVRLTWYVFGPDVLNGSWAHLAAFALACVTTVYGACMALSSQRLKLRLAWSTIGQLAYALLGALLLTPSGLSAGMTQMAAHALIKANLYFCAGAILCQSGREFLFDMRGWGFGMPATFLAFLLSGLALVGLPPMAGFIAKWRLGIAAASAGASSPIGFFGLAAMLTSALLATFYVLQVLCVAVMPGRGFNLRAANYGITDPGPAMLIPIGLLAVGALLLGLWAEPVLGFFERAVPGTLPEAIP